MVGETPFKQENVSIINDTHYRDQLKNQSTKYDYGNTDFERELEEMFCKVGNDWSCKMCGKTAKTRGSLKLHAEAMHIEGLQFDCNACDQSFRSRNNLAKHKFRCHRN